MRDIPLEQKSITDLRSVAQAIGAEFTFADDKQTLIALIRGNEDKPLPEKPPVIKWKA